MSDVPYTTPILLNGSDIATLSGQPYNQGNPGDANFGIVMPGVQAMGTSSSTYRLVWFQNTNATDIQFGNGQVWKLQSYSSGGDGDQDPATGNDGWSDVSGYTFLVPKHDLVSNLGDGDDYIVFESQSNGGHLLYDIRGNLPATPTTLTYLASGENGLATSGDNDGHLDFYDAYSAFCFAAGTMIATANGACPVEMLAIGDRVITADHGFQPIRWIGRRDLSARDLRASPNLRPICVRAGALGPGVPARDLVLSPQHRVLVSSKIAARLFGESEVLIPAKYLLPLRGVDILPPHHGTSYIHLAFDQHEIVTANGTSAESLYPGRQALRAIPVAARRELVTLFPELESGATKMPPGRPLVQGKRAHDLVARHQKHARALV